MKGKEGMTTGKAWNEKEGVDGVDGGVGEDEAGTLIDRGRRTATDGSALTTYRNETNRDFRALREPSAFTAAEVEIRPVW